MSTAYEVPGVYFESRPRSETAPVVRTDVVGFVGFEPRVRDGSTPSGFTGGTLPTGHSFRVDVAGFEVEIAGREVTFGGAVDHVLSEDAGSTLLADGQSIVFGLAAARDGAEVTLVTTPGSIGPSTPHPPASPSDADVDGRVSAVLGGAREWTRIADVEIRREGARARVFVRSVLPPARCDDWRDYVLRVGPVTDDGALLGPAVRAFFANGGSRCYIATVGRPQFDDAVGLSRAREQFLGVQGASFADATGLERLLLVDEVMMVDFPDLYGRRLVVDEPAERLPPAEADACFGDCSRVGRRPVETRASGVREAHEPLYDSAVVFDFQRRVLERAARERWRLLVLLSPPLTLDPSDGLYHGPSLPEVEAWRQQFGSAGLTSEERSCGALYFPWVLAQEQVGAPVVEMPPTPFVAGVIARRDLARGPHVSPANESLRGVVGLTRRVDPAAFASVYRPPFAVNPLRASGGYGIEVWGARTLSEDLWLRHVAVRRCLSAIERRVFKALEPIVFEPNNQMLWLRVTQLVFAILLPVLESGALRGSRPDESFFVRCDASNNPPEAVADGRLLCEVGVAIAAPAEFIVFRIGRREGVVEVLE